MTIGISERRACKAPTLLVTELPRAARGRAHKARGLGSVVAVQPHISSLDQHQEAESLLSQALTALLPPGIPARRLSPALCSEAPGLLKDLHFVADSW